MHNELDILAENKEGKRGGQGQGQRRYWCAALIGSLILYGQLATATTRAGLRTCCSCLTCPPQKADREREN